MQISSRFTVALHIFACTEYFKDKCKVTSDFLASSINTNPVIIRRILSQLSKAEAAEGYHIPGCLQGGRAHRGWNAFPLP